MTDNLVGYELVQAASEALLCQDGCNSSGIARSMVRAMDAIRAVPGNGTRGVNTHPITCMFLYKLLALAGYENLFLPYDVWEAQCKAILAAAAEREGVAK